MTDQWEEEQINNHRDNNRNVHLAPDSLVLLVKQQAQGPARGRWGRSFNPAAIREVYFRYC